MNVRIRMGCFYETLPLLAARHHGIYLRHGLEVEHERVSSSTQQFAFLRDGGYDLVQTSPDNVANYRYNRGNPLGERIDVQGFLGMDHGLLLVLVTPPEVESLEMLRGETVAVDAVASGFAYVLYAILEEAGLRREEDYRVLPVGGVATRFEQLTSGSPPFQGTLLSGGYETRARNAGFRLHRSAHDIADPYVGAWAAARAEWLLANAATAAAFASAYREATAWALDPANREEAVELLTRLPDTPRRLAEQLYEIQVRPAVGNIPGADLAIEGVRNVLELRRRFGGFEQDVDLEAALTDGELFSLGPLSEAG